MPLVRRPVAGLVFAVVLCSAGLSGAQEQADCRWATDPAATRNAILSGVTAVDPTTVWAVGSRYGSDDWGRTLVRRWDGTSWQTYPSPTVEEQTNHLNDVAVEPDGAAWAVGDRSRRTMKTIVQRYDGTRWRMQRSLNPSETLNSLEAVDVTPTGSVYAVGSRWNDNRRYRTMIQHFDGADWRMVRVGRPGLLYDVDVVGDGDVWAVGVKTEHRAAGAYAVHFDGETWTEVAAPDVGGGFSILRGVSAAAPDDVWAVGAYHENSEPQPLILHFDGTSWSVAQLPGLDSDVEIFDVSALDAATAVAVGQQHSYDFGEDSRVVLEWDGSAWTRAVQDDDRVSNWLHAVDLAPDGQAWAVGYHSTHPLTSYVEHRTCG